MRRITKTQKSLFIQFIFLAIFIFVLIPFQTCPQITFIEETTNVHVSNPKISNIYYNNATVISDKWDDGKEWNTGFSASPAVVIDNLGNLHVVWSDFTPGPWGIGGKTDSEIMYANFTASTGQWSNATVISDKWDDGKEWNTDESSVPDIDVDSFGNIHVVWQDKTSGAWGGGSSDFEIMYANFTAATGQWSNATVISDKWNDGTEWNTGGSYNPDIAVDSSGNLHVVWCDKTPGAWGGGSSDYEIMYANFTAAMGQWSNATVISDKWDDGTEWNTGHSYSPDVVVDSSGNLHVVWQDETPGAWGGGSSDTEIMYTKYTTTMNQWSNATVISDKWDDGKQWNTGQSSESDIAVDSSGILHVVWSDKTPGVWGIGGDFDPEIMYTKITISKGGGGVGILPADDDDDDDNDKAAITFGHYHLLFAVLAIGVLVIVYKRKTFLNKR